MSRQIIIRADDLGYSEAVNLGIIKTVQNGLIKNVGVMVNMPTVLEAVQILQKINPHIDLGLHVVICMGRPLQNACQLPSLTMPDGTFKTSKMYRKATRDFVSLDEVVSEIEAQYQRFVKLVGRQPDYFEGHAVVSDNFVKGLKIVAQRHHLKYLEYHFDDQPTLVARQKLYIEMDSMEPNYDPYRTLRTTALTKHDDGYEVMVCHPGYLDNFILQHSSLTIPRTQEVAMLCDPQTKIWLWDHEVELIKYSQL
ncbi:ChbG/HpnK family deacetylase [Bombilactobacillus folatiphilus]|uniref:ChbG/HpnK family deacetylase n=1 Tax=Bombilactobacillus folatiphilus TaxID=2923362 RepID=A0ABY4PBB3_9LACO|nr:ChbG/HpnK family deacetylase [Bombilactobacillus folatiphilus]UQS82816.1 ChbG/HpnK family deacetylase [Bombilactobacillus folatiphilus]